MACRISMQVNTASHALNTAQRINQCMHEAGTWRRRRRQAGRHGGGGHAVHCIFELSRAEHAHRHARTRTKHKPTFLYEHTHTHTHRSQIASVWDFRRGFSGTRTRTTDKAMAVRTSREAEDAVSFGFRYSRIRSWHL